MKDRNDCPNFSFSLRVSMDGIDHLLSYSAKKSDSLFWLFFSLSLYILWLFRANRFHPHEHPQFISFFLHLYGHCLTLGSFVFCLDYSKGFLFGISNWFHEETTQTDSTRFPAELGLWLGRVSESTGSGEQILLTWGGQGKRPECFQQWVGLLE